MMSGSAAAYFASASIHLTRLRRGECLRLPAESFLRSGLKIHATKTAARGRARRASGPHLVIERVESVPREFCAWIVCPLRIFQAFVAFEQQWFSFVITLFDGQTFAQRALGEGHPVMFLRQ